MVSWLPAMPSSNAPISTVASVATDDSAPISSSVPSSSVAPVPTTTSTTLASAAPPVTTSVPPVIVRSPVKLLVPDRVNSPAPIFSSGREPPISLMLPDCSAVSAASTTSSCVVSEFSTMGVAELTPSA